MIKKLNDCMNVTSHFIYIYLAITFSLVFPQAYLRGNWGKFLLSYSFWFEKTLTSLQNRLYH